MHEQNETRAMWAQDALDTFAAEVYHGRSFQGDLVRYAPDECTIDSDAYTMVQDLISNLLHLTVKTGWDPAEMFRKAVAGFDYENSPDYEGD